MSSFRAFMPSRQSKVSSQAWPLICLDGIKPCGPFIPQEQKNNKNNARKTFFNRMELWFQKDFVFHVFPLPAIGPTGCWGGEGQGVKLA